MTREEAITIIDNLHLMGCGRNQHEDDLKINEALDMAIEALKNEPIRCGECVHGEDEGSRKTLCMSCDLNPYCRYTKDHFCAYGERREE